MVNNFPFPLVKTTRQMGSSHTAHAIGFLLPLGPDLAAPAGRGGQDAAPQQVRKLRILTMTLELSSGSETRGKAPDSDRAGSYSSCRSCG